MSNMSYCRFENTANDLADCADAMHEPCSEREHRARKRLAKLCASIIEGLALAEIGDDLDEAVDQAEHLPVD